MLKPTEPQERAIPILMRGENVLLIAPTGTGKTEAALLPMLARLMDDPRGEGIRLLYVTPLRALNRDLMLRISWWASRLDLTVGVRHGDTPQIERRAQLARPPDILVTTPETLQILLVARKFRRHLASVKYLIVDEVHELAESKRGAQLALALERLKVLAGRHPQIAGLSATVGSPEEVARFLAGSSPMPHVVYVSAAKRMEISIEYPKPTPVDEKLAGRLYVPPEVAARLRRIRELIEGARTTLIFTNTRSMAEVLGSRLRMWDSSLAMGVHHGSLAAKARITAERALREGRVRSLVSTSSLELGIDVGHVDLVIQYMSPRQATRLVQRVGRSGHRVGEVSRGVVIVMTPDDALESMVVRSRALQDRLEPVKIPEKPYDALLHEIVALLMWKPEWAVQEALGVIRRAHNYRRTEPGELMDLVRFLASLPRSPVLASESGSFRRGPGFAALYPYYFENLSMIPEIKTYLVVDQDTEEPVGTLDEPFVAERGEPGSKFIMAGEVWRIVQVFRDRVYVVRDPDPEGAIPHWLGEEIPVPMSVSQEVGLIRARVEEMIVSGRSRADVTRAIAEEYGVAESTVLPALLPTIETAERGLPVPTHRRVVVEAADETVVVHVHAGTLANRALARYLAEAISRETGASVGVAEDPYRVYLSGHLVSPDSVAEVLRSPPLDVGETLRAAVERSGYFRFRLLQAARKMGVLSRDAEVTPAVLDRLMASLEGTPVYRQAVRDVLERDMSIPEARQVLDRLTSGEWELVNMGRVAEPTPVCRDALRWMRLRLEAIPPDKRRLLRRERLRVRLLTERITLACLSCGGYAEEVEPYELPARPECPICGSRRLGVSREPELVAEQALSLSEKALKSKSRRKMRRIVSELRKTAALVEAHGRLAVLALAAGIPPRAAADLLAKSGGSEISLLDAIMDFIARRTRRGTRGGG